MSSLFSRPYFIIRLFWPTERNKQEGGADDEQQHDERKQHEHRAYSAVVFWLDLLDHSMKVLDFWMRPPARQGSSSGISPRAVTSSGGGGVGVDRVVPTVGISFYLSIIISCPPLLTRFWERTWRVIVGDHSSIQVPDISDGTPSSMMCAKSFPLLP